MDQGDGKLIINGVDHSHAFNRFFLWLVLGLSVLHLLFPRLAWRSWQYRDGAEPSESWELLVRFICLICLLCTLYRLNNGVSNTALENILKFLPDPYR